MQKVEEKNLWRFEKLKLGIESEMTLNRVRFIICFKISPISVMFEEKPDISTPGLHELHDRKLRNQFMMEQNRECQSYFGTF